MGMYSHGQVVTVQDFPDIGNVTDCHIISCLPDSKYKVYNRDLDSAGFINEEQIIAILKAPTLSFPWKEDILKQDLPLYTKDSQSVEHDPVNHPKHYTSSKAKCSACGHPIECIDVTRHMNFDIGNSVKYLWRCDLKKDAIEDLKKTIWYLNDEIAKREKEKNDVRT